MANKKWTVVRISRGQYVLVIDGEKLDSMAYKKRACYQTARILGLRPENEELAEKA